MYVYTRQRRMMNSRNKVAQGNDVRGMGVAGRVRLDYSFYKIRDDDTSNSC